MNYLEVIYFALPAFAANAAPVLTARLGLLKSLTIPLDGGLKWRGRPLLGKNKTWRGITAAIVFAACTTALQYTVVGPPRLPAPLETSLMYALVYGMFVGIICMAGDAVESFVKRAFDIASGEPFIPFDQIDYMIAFLIGTWWLFDWSYANALFLLLCTFFANLITNFLMYKVGIKSTHW